MGRAWIIPTTSTMHMWRTWHACHSNGTRQSDPAGLKPEYELIKVQILANENLRRRDNVLPVLLNEEARQLAMNNPMHHNIKASALLARGHWSFTNHTTQSGRGRNGGLNRPVCSHCGKPNHTVDRFWELHGKPDDLPKSMERKREISPHTQL